MDHPSRFLFSSSPKLLFYFVAFIYLTTFTILASPQVGGNETDRLALLEIKAKMVDPAGILSSWNESNNFCKWYGVTCDHRHQRVTMLSLNSLGLSGPVSPHIGNLSFLRELHLQNNSFISNIPSQLGALLQLEKLFLNNNSFSGHIPSNLSRCANLTILGLGFNKLEGNLPEELGSLSKLLGFVFEDNNLIGNIPSSFRNLSSLKLFGVANNNLGGTIPDTLGQLRNLSMLSLGGNRFVGMFPSSIFNISSITHLDVSENKLEGNLPGNLGFKLPNLQVLYLNNNPFTGEIPKSISNASNLREFQIAMNNFTGDVPSFARMRQLEWLVMSGSALGNGRYGDLNFLCSLTNSTSLQMLGMDHNNFGGNIPECIGNLSVTLQQLSMDYNAISGSLPDDIGNLINLELLVLSGNHISGFIPHSLANLKQLRIIFFDQNEFSGQIPHFLGNLSLLTKLLLYSNNLHGSIPSYLGKLDNLLELDLSNNSLSGSIPPELFGLSSLSIYLNLSLNNLNGTIPKEVGNLKSVGELDLSNNRLFGEIPSSIGGCTSMERLYLQYNFFEGPLPSTLSSLRGIRVMNVSNNRLSGPIPAFLGSLSLSNLSLSYNDFDGALPTEGVFKSVSSTSVVGNKRLCGGLPEFKLPKCNFTKLHVTKMSRASKVVIICSVLDIVSIACILYLLYFFWYKHNKNATTSSSPEHGLLKVSYHNLVKATDGFSSKNLVGVGSFGSVYKGLLDQTQTIVAIKILNLTRHGASRTFIAECDALRKIRHRNLMKVLTACSGIDFSGNDFKALIYEFMEGGSLEELLHPSAPKIEARRTFNLIERVNIAIDVACALDYLHHHCETPIVHCDLKPSNVLLNGELVAHIGDFGLARFLIEANHNLQMDETSSIGIKGSIGYIAPEYGSGIKASTSGDVYSYGVLILEMFMGKRPIDAMFQDGLNIHGFAKAALAGPIGKVIDPSLVQEIEEFQMHRNISSVNERNVEELLVSIIEIGVICSSESPMNRMDITDALTKLQKIREKLLL